MNRYLSLAGALFLALAGMAAPAQAEDATAVAKRELDRFEARIGLSAQAIWPDLTPELKTRQQRNPYTLVVIGTDWQGGIEGLEHLRHLPELRGLMFSHPEFSDEWAQVLRDLPQLKQLYITSSYEDEEHQFTNRGLAHLENLKDLDVLSLFSTRVTDKGLRYLNGMSKLRTLRLVGSFDITDQGMIHLSELSQLRHLNLDATEVTGQGVGCLEKAKHLEWVRLSGLVDSKRSGILTPGFKHLTGFKNLQYLDPNHMVWYDGETRDAMELLKNVPSLQRIEGDTLVLTREGWQVNKEPELPTEERIQQVVEDKVRENLDLD